jgi:hypothetical protein
MCLLAYSAGVPDFARPKSYAIFGALLKKKNSKLRNRKLGTKVSVYLECEKKSHKRITNLKRVTYTAKITEFRKMTYFY